MKIILRTIYAGPNGTFQPGPADLDDKTAKGLIAAGYAVAASATPPAPRTKQRRGAPAIETAEARPAEETATAVPPAPTSEGADTTPEVPAGD